jgi:hypothetical protein
MRAMALIAACGILAAAACTTTPAEEPQGVIVGGFAPASGDEPGYKEAEALAIDTIYKREPQRSLVESKSAQVQVVAGLNFRFDIKMSGQNRYTVQVYRNLQGGMEVTEFTKTAP